jgi:putative ABC transport system permease protein
MTTPRFRWLLAVYPPSLRRDHGDEIAHAIDADWRRRPGFVSRTGLLAKVLIDAIASWIRPARRSNGGPASSRQQWWRNAGGDTRDALRLFSRAPLLVAGAVTTLGLGIGSVTAIFSLADATLLRPLPIPDANRVLQMTWSWAYPEFRDLERRQGSFTDIAAWATLNAGVEVQGRTEVARIAGVSTAYWRLAGQVPLEGRLLDDGDASRDRPIAALLSERIWTRIFARDPSVVGQTYNMNRRPVTVVGILPRRFRGLSLSESPEIFVALPRVPEIATGFLGRPSILTSRSTVWLEVAGRLRPGVTMAQADADVTALYRQIHPPKDASAPERAEASVVSAPARALGLNESSDLRRFLLLLIGATVVTLGLACATVANLLLVRAERRRHELAVRAALGAGRSRLLRLFMAESLGIGVAGAVLALGVASAALELLGAFTLPGRIAVSDLDLHLNSTVLGLSLALGVATSVLFGLAPLWPAARVPLTDTLRDGSRVSARQPLRSALVTVQVSLCVLLLGGGLVFSRAVRQVFVIDRGFDAEHTLMAAVAPTVVRYDAARKANLYRQVLDQLGREPWVRAAAWSSLPPLSGRMMWTLGIPGYSPSNPDELFLDANAVTNGFFEAMGIRLVAGRNFDETDVAGAPMVIVVSEGFARKFWPAGKAVGQQVSLDPEAKPQVYATVIGVVNDVRRGLERLPDPTAYAPLAQHPDMLDFGQQRLIVRATIPVDVAAGLTTAVIHQVDPLVPVTEARPIREHLRDAAAAQRLGLTLFLSFAGVAVVLTTFGVYAVVASAIARRTREIGIRMALGARATGVLGLVVGQGLVPAGVGLAAGYGAFALASPLLERFALKVPALGVVNGALLTLAVGVVAVVAMVVPAVRALRVDPVKALREQ